MSTPFAGYPIISFDYEAPSVMMIQILNGKQCWRESRHGQLIVNAFTHSLQINGSYDRPQLGKLWGMAHQSFSRGVFTPSKQNLIILFVTKEKQECLTQYQDFIQDDLLFWEGEQGHGSDQRIAHASQNREEIHLFYRTRHHSHFTYHGRIILVGWTPFRDKPSEFRFLVPALSAMSTIPPQETLDFEADFEVLSQAGLNSIDKAVTTKSRGIAQRVFRGNLLKLWKGTCAVTGVQETRILISSHIKPWASATSHEKVDRFNGLLLVPNLDSLFNEGLISFRDDGCVVLANSFQRDDRQRMRIDDNTHLTHVHAESLPYLEYHRKKFRL